MNPYPDAIHYEYADKLHPLTRRGQEEFCAIALGGEESDETRHGDALRIPGTSSHRESQEARREEQARLQVSHLGRKVERADEAPQIAGTQEVALPGNAGSYNPPRECLFTEQEREE